ncbi:MAG: photosystem II biogenesis protein Psp29 [Cyanobacteria bacterium KgW148]|nr:photosystem II biogenesis protein Psp29 [Cyanobacteria bacterium KgW148]
MNTVPTVSDAKRAFFKAFPQPISAIYRKIVDELLVELHLLTVNQTFRYDSVFALGVITVFDRFMEGYPGDLLPLGEALFQAVRLSMQQLRQDAERLRTLATNHGAELLQFLTTLANNTNIDLSPLDAQLKEIAANPQFKYSRLFAVGLFTLIETIVDDKEKQTEVLKQCCHTLYPHWNQQDSSPADRFLRDLDLYRSNLEKAQQAKLMMSELVEAEKKKKAKVQK